MQLKTVSLLKVFISLVLVCFEHFFLRVLEASQSLKGEIIMAFVYLIERTILNDFGVYQTEIMNLALLEEPSDLQILEIAQEDFYRSDVKFSWVVCEGECLANISKGESPLRFDDSHFTQLVKYSLMSREIKVLE